MARQQGTRQPAPDWRAAKKEEACTRRRTIRDNSVSVHHYSRKDAL